MSTDGDRVLSTGDFWRLTAEGLPDSARRVLVVGAGETAGTIVRELSLSLHRDVTVVTPWATIYSRGESFFENRYYSDPTGWTSLTEADRREFIRRTDRAVFSQEVQRELALAANVTWEPGRVIGTHHMTDGQFAVDLVVSSPFLPRAQEHYTRDPTDDHRSLGTERGFCPVALHRHRGTPEDVGGPRQPLGRGTRPGLDPRRGSATRVRRRPAQRPPAGPGHIDTHTQALDHPLRAGDRDGLLRRPSVGRADSKPP